MRQEELYSDQQLQALFSEYKIVEPELQCDKQRKIYRMCVNSECQKHALICQDLQCESCGIKHHRLCVSLPLQVLTQILNETTQKQKDFTSEVCKIENRFIDEIYNSRKALTKRYYLGDLQENQLKFVEEIYKNKNTKCLTGKEATAFYERIIKFNAKPN